MAKSGRNDENSNNIIEEDPPPILSSGALGVFPLFASMLDVHSFMKLAMASKKMYKRCMEDKGIIISLEEKEVAVRIVNGIPIYSFHSFDVADNHIEKYLEKLAQLKCNIALKTIHFQEHNANINIIAETRRYLEKLGVKTIDSLKIDSEFTFQQAVAFIEDYHVKDVEIEHELPDDDLRSLLSLRLSSFSYSRPCQGDLLLHVDSQIQQLNLPSLDVNAEILSQILHKIQTGPLKKLTTSHYNVPWDSFPHIHISEDDDDRLAENRPLVIHGINNWTWFLHWNGAMTMCVSHDHNVEFSKCKAEFPPVLLSKELVHRALTEKVERILCMKSHFTSFFDGANVVRSSHEGPLPEERPLVFNDDTEDFNCYCVINGDGSTSSYTWEYGNVECETYDMEENFPVIYNHTPLLKFVLEKRIEKRTKEGTFYCQNMEEFCCLFGDYESLPHDFSGQLPERRPLVFEKTLFSDDEDVDDDDDDYVEIEEEIRIILYDDGTLIQYICDSDSLVSINPCHPENLPLMMRSPESFNATILDTAAREFTYSITLDKFRDAFKEIRTLSFDASGDLPKERPLVFKKIDVRDGEIVERRWILFKFGEVRTWKWKDGQATLSRGDPRKFPFILTKSLVKDFFKGEVINTDMGFYIDHDVLDQCLDCEILPYDDADFLADERPVIFEKSERKHSCRENPQYSCECIDEILHYWFVSENEKVIHVTWGSEKRRFLSFDKKPCPCDIPPALKTKETLEFNLQSPWLPEEWRVHWYGSREDFVGFFESQRIVDFNHEGRLPKTRPLVFKEDDQAYHYLRQDDLLIRCTWSATGALLHISPKSNYFRPVALRFD